MTLCTSSPSTSSEDSSLCSASRAHRFSSDLKSSPTSDRKADRMEGTGLSPPSSSWRSSLTEDRPRRHRILSEMDS